MKTRPSHTRQKPNANGRVPSGLTSYLRNQISNLESNPRNDYLKQEAFSKYTSELTDPPRVRQVRALNKWLATEVENEATEVRLLTAAPTENVLPGISLESFYATCRSFLVDIIGTTPEYDILFGGFSGGATTSRRRAHGHPARKFTGKADATSDALELFRNLTDSESLFSTASYEEIRVVPGNILFYVPKSSDIDRIAAKEPDLNMYLQRGIGLSIRNSLKRVGINLNDQSRNRRLAQQGSRDGSLATLDLSSASDSVTLQLCFELFPLPWFELLRAARSPYTLVDGEWHKNTMLSSMGNGFTFEVESLLFYVLARATAYHTRSRGTISVYGDDIICPSILAPHLVDVLLFCGFSVNPKKSFWSGSFRESCGGHYFDGRDITPFYVKSELKTLIDLIHACNQIRKWSERGWDILSMDLEETWSLLSSYIPRRLTGGYNTSDKSRLVTYTRPETEFELVAVQQKQRPLPEIGRYLMWHNACWNTDLAAGEVTPALSVTQHFKLKRVPEIRRRTDMYAFLSEVCGHSGNEELVVPQTS